MHLIEYLKTFYAAPITLLGRSGSSEAEGRGTTATRQVLLSLCLPLGNLEEKERAALSAALRAQRRECSAKRDEVGNHGPGHGVLQKPGAGLWRML